MKINNYAKVKIFMLVYILVGILLIVMFSVIVSSAEEPFARQQKYGKYRTKQAHHVSAKRDNREAFPFAPEKRHYKTKKNKRDNGKEAWIFKQWGRN